MRLECQDIDFEVRRGVQKGCLLVVLWQCGDVIFIPPASSAEVIPSSPVGSIDICEGPRYLLVPNHPLIALFRGLVDSYGATARAAICIAKVKFALLTALRLRNCAFSVAKDEFGLNANLMLHESTLMYLLPAVVPGTVTVRFLNLNLGDATRR